MASHSIELASSTAYGFYSLRWKRPRPLGPGIYTQQRQTQECSLEMLVGKPLYFVSLEPGHSKPFGVKKRAATGARGSPEAQHAVTSPPIAPRARRYCYLRPCDERGPHGRQPSEDGQ